MKFKLYPVAIVAVLLGIVVLLLGRFDLDIAIESNSPAPSPVFVPPNSQESEQSTPSETPTPSASASPSPSISPNPPATPGGLRVSNQTEHPVRVAVLLKADQQTYGEPAHWDFAPGEGGAKGLILSLPDQNLQLQKGDVLVAFAQDGSRQYWGPFVVGETVEPVWSNQTEEWQLILRP